MERPPPTAPRHRIRGTDLLLPLQAPTSTIDHDQPAAGLAADTTPPDRGDANADPAVADRLAALLRAAASIEPTERAAWDRLRAAARGVLGPLIAAGILPAHLDVGPADAPVLVSRTLAAAWVRVTDAPRRAV